MFLRPIATDVANLQEPLHQFGQATGLCTNIQKSEIAPISCQDINISAILGEFQVALTSLLWRYHGLPLSLGKLRRGDQQKLIAKVATKLPLWKGRFLNKSGRLTLVNSVLSSVVVYHMMVFSLSKWAIKRIDKIRCNFLWNGFEEPQRGHCIVN
jgi:hypothetical protein